MRLFRRPHAPAGPRRPPRRPSAVRTLHGTPGSCWTARRIGPVALLLAGVALASAPLAAQTYEGTRASTIGGAALGFYSGGVLGLVGTMMPCNRILNGDRCVASGVGTGAAMGLVMGGLIGGENTLALDQRVENAGIGVLVGAAVGVGLRSAVRQYGWADVAASAALGGAFGAAPKGALIGTGAGMVTGALVWWLIPDSGIADMIMMTLVGAGVGGLVDWGEGAATAKRERPDPFPLFTIRIG